MRVLAILCCLLAISSLPTMATEKGACPYWPKAEKKLRHHNYTVKHLSSIGVKRVIAYLTSRNADAANLTSVPGLTGFSATTKYILITDANDVGMGYLPTNKGYIELVDQQGNCVATIDGTTVEGVNSILIGDEQRYSEAVEP